MHAALALLVLAGALVTVRPGPQDGCPSSRQVQEALTRRTPGAVIGWVPARRDADVWEVVVETRAGRATQVALLDHLGAVRLRRDLPPPGGAQGACGALADTVALIVERFLQDVVLDVPPAPVVSNPVTPQLSRWELGLGPAWNPGRRDGGAVDLGLQVTRGLGVGNRGLVRLSLALTGDAGLTWEGGSLSLVRGTVLAEAGRRFLAGPGAWELTGGLGGMRMHVAARVLDRPRQVTRLTPVVSAGGAYRIGPGRWWYVRPGVSAAVALHRFEYVAPLPANVAFRTQRVYGRVFVEFGLAFP